jgi:hypothetical protein
MLPFTHAIRRTRAVVRCVLTLLLAMSGIRLYAALPPLVSLVVSVREPLVDENGVRLEGTDPSSVCFHIPAVEGDRVEIYLTSDGQIYPPDAQGDPDYRNQLIKTLSIGSGAAPNEFNPGKFGCVISPRPAGGAQVFVRVFNAPERQDASYYSDSGLYTVSSVVNEPWWATFPCRDDTAGHHRTTTAMASIIRGKSAWERIRLWSIPTAMASPIAMN